MSAANLKGFRGKNLPAEDEALFHLAKGDASLALALLEALMDKNIEYSAALPVGDKRDALLPKPLAMPLFRNSGSHVRSASGNRFF